MRSRANYFKCKCKRTAHITRGGRKIYARWYRKRCFVLHTRNCPNRKRRT